MRKFTILQSLDLKKGIEKRDLYKGVLIVVQVDLQIKINLCKESFQYAASTTTIYLFRSDH